MLLVPTKRLLRSIVLGVYFLINYYSLVKPECKPVFRASYPTVHCCTGPATALGNIRVWKEFPDQGVAHI